MFGVKDEDWQFYKFMSKDYDEDDERFDLDEVELVCLLFRFQEIDLMFELKVEGELGQVLGEVLCVCLLMEEDYKIVIGVERFRCLEILFYFNFVGID